MKMNLKIGWDQMQHILIFSEEENAPSYLFAALEHHDGQGVEVSAVPGGMAPSNVYVIRPVLWLLGARGSLWEWPLT